MFQNTSFKAAFLALFASLILGFVDQFVIEVSNEAGLWQFQVFRALIALLMLFCFGFFKGTSFKIHNFKKLIIRSFAVSTGLLIYFISINLFSVSAAGSGLYTAPLWVLIFSLALFKTPITVFQFLAMAIGFLGALFVLQPDFKMLDSLFLLPLVSGLFYGLGMLLTGHYCQEEKPLILAIGVFITLGFFSFLVLLWFTFFPSEKPDFLTKGFQIPSLTFTWLTFIQALGAVFAVTFISEAYRIAPPPFVAVFEYSFLIFASFWAYILFETTHSIAALYGILLIILSGLLLSFYQKKKLS